MFEHGVGLRNPLFFIGSVEKIDDPRREGRVAVRAFGIHGTWDQVKPDELPWAICVQGDYSGNNIPPLNSWVFGVFLDGRDGQEPLVLGLLPTQHTVGINPPVTGWGHIPDKDGDLTARGSDPQSLYQPTISRKARGEYIHETSVLQQEMGRTRKVKMGGIDSTWDQPAAAYGAKYPHNKVIETGRHSIELDDTPGSERITITHNSGSFIEIDDRGTTVNKTVGDHYDVMDRNQHVVVSGMSTVTIMGNSHVYVRGNKIEEIEGDLQTLVHGNHHLSVGGQSTHQAGEQVQIRGGADVKINAGSGTLAINAGKELQLSGGGINEFGGNYGAISIKSEKIMVDATDKLHLRGNTQVNIQAIAEMNMSAIDMNMATLGSWNAFAGTDATITGTARTEISGLIELAISSGSKVNLNAPVIAADVFITLANGASRPAAPVNPATVSKFLQPPVGQKPFVPGSAVPEIAWYAAKVEAPEPVVKSTSILPRYGPSSYGVSGYSSRDDGETGVSFNPGETINVSTAISHAASELLDFIGNKEAPRGYDQIVGLVSRSRYPTKRLTEMTIGEVLAWQESVDRSSNSEAVGRYQIMEDTLRGYNNDRTGKGTTRGLYERVGLSEGDLFSPENQDKMAIYLLEEDGLTRYINGEITTERFANNIAATWASMPLVTGPNAGRSKYESDINRALVPVEPFLNAVRSVKTRAEQLQNERNRPAGPGGNGGV